MLSGCSCRMGDTSVRVPRSCSELFVPFTGAPARGVICMESCCFSLWNLDCWSPYSAAFQTLHPQVGEQPWKKDLNTMKINLCFWLSCCGSCSGSWAVGEPAPVCAPPALRYSWMQWHLLCCLLCLAGFHPWADDLEIQNKTSEWTADTLPW